MLDQAGMEVFFINNCQTVLEFEFEKFEIYLSLEFCALSFKPGGPYLDLAH